MPHGSTNAPSVRMQYERRVDDGTLEADPAQRALADRLDTLIMSFAGNGSSAGSKSSPLGWLFAKRKAEPQARGLYIHGSVGRGKTMLMDWFHELVPMPTKKRVHFFAFMEDVHKRINAHRQAFKRGETKEEDPIAPVARSIASEARLISFDEFHVLDIADAMILLRLFNVLFEEGVTLVATSNVEPDALYENGLNRALFLPFIELLKAHCDIWNLDARTDYRRERLSHFAAYQTPLGPQADAAMDEAFALATAHEIVAPLTISVRGHDVHIPAASLTAARFTFDDLCAKPLGAADYIALAAKFATIFVDHVPTLDYSKRNEAKRFIILIDVLYDNGNRLFLSAANPPDEIYRVPAGLKVGEFARASSRLVQMTSKEWIQAWESQKPTHEILTQSSDIA